jgi:hypothetical protein
MLATRAVRLVVGHNKLYYPDINSAGTTVYAVSGALATAKTKKLQRTSTS